MSVSDVQYNSLLARVKALENKVNDLTTMISKLVSIDQVTALGLIRQTEIATLKTQMEGVETRVTTLESYHQS